MNRGCHSFLPPLSGVLVPGGFGIRGTEGKMLAINWARKQNKPFLGKRDLTLFTHTFCLLLHYIIWEDFKQT